MIYCSSNIFLGGDGKELGRFVMSFSSTTHNFTRSSLVNTMFYATNVQTKVV